MTDKTKAKKPVAARGAKAPATHEQTKPVEKVITPQNNTTEAYGKSSESARRKTKG